jgi:alpha-1,3-mannosyltransferase
MNILLFLPGLLVVLFQARGFFGTLDSVIIMGFVQLGLPMVEFFNTGDQIRAYFGSAFDFSRQFMHQWTVNWKFVSEERFLDPHFARALVAGHMTVLIAFGLYRWSPFPGGTPAVLSKGLWNLRALFKAPVGLEAFPSERMCFAV